MHLESGLHVADRHWLAEGAVVHAVERLVELLHRQRGALDMLQLVLEANHLTDALERCQRHRAGSGDGLLPHLLLVVPYLDVRGEVLEDQRGRNTADHARPMSAA